MQEEAIQEYYLIETKQFEELLRRNFMLSQSVLIFEYLCSKSDRPMFLSAQGVCEVLGIDARQLEESRQKRIIKAKVYQRQMMYEAYDLVALSEKLNRRRMQRQLAKIPRYTMR